jgi:hypothetical protein
MTSEPITTTCHREIRVGPRGVDDVTEEPVHSRSKGVEPRSIMPSNVKERVVTRLNNHLPGNNGGGGKEVAIVKVMIVIESIPEVNIYIVKSGASDDTSPSCFICRYCLRGGLELGNQSWKLVRKRI